MSLGPERSGVVDALGSIINKKLGAACLAFGLGAAGLGYLESGSETHILINGGHGTVTDTWIDANPTECLGGYTTMIQGASAYTGQVIYPFNHAVETTNNASETFNGKVAAHVCNATGLKSDGHNITGYDLKVFDDDVVDYPGQKRHIKIKVAASAFSETVYPENPADPNAWASHKDTLALLGSMFDDIKNLPSGENTVATSTDKMMNRLQGWAILAAYQTVSQSCGKVAWNLLEPGYKTALIRQEIANNNAHLHGNDYAVTDKNIEIDLPGPNEIKLPTQYDKLIQQIIDESKKKNYNTKFTWPDPKKATCDQSKDVKVG